MTEYTFSKGTVEKYDIRWSRGEWAVFTIDNATGLMQCHSSYGDWSYAWPNHGRKSFKLFILELEKDWYYLLDKVSDEIFDFDETVKRWKKIIIDWRKQDECTKEQARKIYDFINEDLDESEGETCIRRLEESEARQDINVCVYEEFPLEKNWSGQDIIFAKTIWPMLCDILRKEIKK